MAIRRPASTSLTSLLALVLLYVVLIGLVLGFSNQILNDLSFSRSFSSFLVIALGVLFPLLLVAVIGLNIVRLIRDRAIGRPGVRFKLRLLLFFFIVVLLSSVPQGILSINFIGSSTRVWFNGRTGQALQSAQDITLQYYQEKSSRLSDFAQSSLAKTLLSDVFENPRRAWENVHTVRPEIDAMQVFSNDGTDVYFNGPPQTRLHYNQVQGARLGEVIKDTSGTTSFLRVRVEERPPNGGAPVSVVMSSVLPEGFDSGAAAVTQSLETFRQLDRLQSKFLVGVVLFYAFFSVPLLLLSIMVSFFLSDEIIRPIVQLEEATRRVAEGDFSYRILSRRGDDLSLLVSSFNRMVSELERSRQKLMQTEKVAAWQEIAQRLAHEIKNPLTPIKLSAERILKRFNQLFRGSADRSATPESGEPGSPTPGTISFGAREPGSSPPGASADAPDGRADRADHPNDEGARDSFAKVLESSIRSIISEVDGLSSLLSEFRNFSRLPEPVPEHFPIRDLIVEVIATYGSYGGMRFHSENIDPGLEVVADPSQIRQVFANLFRNAVEAMESTGDVFVRADLVKKGNSSYCRVQVQDTGPGIDSENHDKVFNPYFTTKKHGTGLGLAIVERIVFDHKGQIWFETQKGLGTTFFVDLPVE